jgi:hypothetical protein
MDSYDRVAKVVAPKRESLKVWLLGGVRTQGHAPRRGAITCSLGCVLGESLKRLDCLHVEFGPTTLTPLIIAKQRARACLRSPSWSACSHSNSVPFGLVVTSKPELADNIII